MDLNVPGTTRREIRAQERVIEQAHRINRGVQAGKFPGHRPTVIAVVGRAPEGAFKTPEFLED